MALNTSGPISIAGTTAGVSIQVELGGTGSTQMSLNCAPVRSLAGVPTGAIVMPTCFYGKSNFVPFGCATYGTAGSFTFTVPSGVSKISVVCVGGGSSGSWCSPGCPGNGLAGGGLSYTNCIPVTPSEVLTVVVGPGGIGGTSTCGFFQTGSPSYIARGATKLIEALGGGGSATPGNIANGIGAVRYQSTVAGDQGGGGGAAGYAGCGGKGGLLAPPTAPLSNGSSGSGGAGGGGGASSGRPRSANGGGSGGGGVGLIVQGASGGGGAGGTSTYTGGGGGSGGASGSPSTGPEGTGGAGAVYGGGGGGASCSSPALPSYAGGNGGRGGIRIIYGGTGKSYPNNSAP